MIQDVEIHQGEAVVLNGTIYDQAAPALKNLQNAAIDCRIGKNTTDRLVLRITDTVVNGCFAAVSDSVGGRVQITLSAAATAALDPRAYRWQVIITDAAGKPNVVTDGKFVVKNMLPSS